MKAGASVALSGLTGGSSAVALDPVFRPFVTALAKYLTAQNIPADDAFIHAFTGLLVVALGGAGMYLRLRVINQVEAAHPLTNRLFSPKEE